MQYFRLYLLHPLKFWAQSLKYNNTSYVLYSSKETPQAYQNLLMHYSHTNHSRLLFTMSSSSHVLKLWVNIILHFNYDGCLCKRMLFQLKAVLVSNNHVTHDLINKHFIFTITI